MNWNQLQYIVTTAQEKSITKAAKKLFISQPSLTRLGAEHTARQGKAQRQAQ